ncbi:hypothetical protein BGZ94_008711 [Podila epigama]|nr:hypothetical protein BGZ94_008711 [Podila epigama]
MPRQDYSLPTVIPLPRLAAAKTTIPAQAAAPVGAPPEITAANSSDSSSSSSISSIDEDYDMLEEDLSELDGLLIDIKSLDISRHDAEVPATKPAKPSFVDILLVGVDPSTHGRVIKVDPNMTRTENQAPTLKSTGDVRLDFFFEVIKGAAPSTVQHLVRASWAEHPLDTLRLIFHLRSVLHGKGERKEFYACMDFLRKEHPRTLLYNLRFVPNHGYWKDLLNWLLFECRDNLMNDEYRLTTRRKINKRPKGKTARATAQPSHKRHRAEPKGETKKSGKNPERDLMDDEESDQGKHLTSDEKEEIRKIIITQAEERNKQHSMEAREERLKTAFTRLDRARKRFVEDKFYRALHIEIARLFANALAWDKKRLAEGKPISLAAKWCPSLNMTHDRHTLISTTIAQILFPEKRPDEDQASYVSRVRSQLRQEYYVPLRRASPVLETMMAARQWNEIMYNRVPSVAMKNNKGNFEKHDKERFTEFLDAVNKGTTTIAAQALMPHQLVQEAGTLIGVDADDLRVRTLNAQWDAYVNKLAKNGKIRSSLAICDVSGSMCGEPMEVAIALSLLLAELSEPPFDQVILTFSANPQIYKVEPGSLVDKVAKAYRMEWGMNTDLAKAFGRILLLAVENKLPKEDMVQTLFVFSDMEFDQAVVGGHGTLDQYPQELFTNYNVAKQKFTAAGYDLPQIVFWNLRSSSQGNKPTGATQPGVALVSGFSGMLMKLFLNSEDFLNAMDPILTMERAIHAKEFTMLKVID